MDGSDDQESTDFADKKDDEERQDKNIAVTVENLDADRKSLSLKIKTTLSKKYGENETEPSSQKEKLSSTTLKAGNIPETEPEKSVDNVVDNSEQDTDKIKSTLRDPSEDLSTNKKDDMSSKTLKDIDNHKQKERSSPLTVPQTIDHDPSGFAQPTSTITELINEIASIAYKCIECDIDLSDFKAWKSHLKMHDIDVKYLTEVERISHGECIPDFNCAICGWIGNKKGGLQVHLRSHENDVSCDVCGMMFRKVKELKIHMRNHDVTEHQCDICKKSFPDNRVLVRHVATHTTEKIKRDRHELLCEICSRIFHAPNVLALHLKTHRIQSGFPCEICDITFKRRSRLNNHIKNIHNNVKDSIICRFCRTQYNTKNELDEHLKEHIGEHSIILKNNKMMNIRKTVFKCKECDKVLYRKSHLDAHMMKHTGEKPYICDVCGVGFRVAYALKKHQLVHNGSKPHTCQHCGNCFKLKSSLIRHQRIHTGEKPFVCKTCGKGFTASSYLKTHERVHDDEDGDQVKTWCAICHKRYHNIDIHMKNHFRKQPLIPKSFSRGFGASTSASISTPLTKSTSVTSESKKPELIIPSRIISSTQPISFPLNNYSSLLKDLDTNSTNDTVAASEPNFGESLDGVSTELSRALAEISRNVTKLPMHNISDDDDDGLIGFDNDDNDDNDNNDEDFPSENCGTPDANPDSVQDENLEDENTNQTTDKNIDFDKTQVEAGQSEEIPKEICQDICKDSKVIENIPEKTQVEAGQSEEIPKELCQDICKDLKIPESPKKIDLAIDAETPDNKKQKSTEGFERKLRRSQRTKFNLDANVNDEIRNKKTENKEVPSIEEVDFDEAEDDNTEADSIIQKAILHLDNLIEDQIASDVITKPTKRRRKGQRITCDVCGDGFKDTLAYETHLQIHSNSDKLSQDIIWDFFENHNGIFSCKKCDVECKDEGTAFVHSKFHLGIAPYTCEICDKSFQLAESLKKHYMCHGTYKRFKCEHCNKGFNISSRLKRHLLTHLNMRNFMCETCGSKFNTLSYLKEHMKTHGSAGEERNRKQRNRYKSREKPQCPICGILVRELKDHLNTHKKEKNYQCSHCDKSFASRKVLNKHSRVHLGIKKFVCPYPSCGRAFYEKTFLSRHVLIHEKRKNFNSLKCDYCVATYSNDAELQKHLKLHKSSKWSCDICNRVFEKQNKLEAHVVVHTREKPHKCDRCKAAFTQKGTLQRHMRERHSSLSKLKLT